MRPIGSSRPNKFTAAAVFGALVAIAALRLAGAQPNEFRFEDYTRGEYTSKYKSEAAAKAHLYRLFPKGSDPERLAEFIVSLGGDCKERSEPNYTKLHGNALYCRYSHWFPELIYASITWIVYIHREYDENEISKIEIEMRIDAL